MKSRSTGDVNQSRRDRLHQPVLLSWFHSLSATPAFVLLENKPVLLVCKSRLGLDCRLGCKGCSHLEQIPHAAWWEAEPSLCCPVSSTLHQNCFVCHQVIKVVDRSAVSGDVVLKLGQRGLSLQKDVGSWRPHMPVPVAVTSWLPLPSQLWEEDIITLWLGPSIQHLQW